MTSAAAQAQELPHLKVYQGSMLPCCSGWTVVEPPVGTPYRWCRLEFDADARVMTVILTVEPPL